MLYVGGRKSDKGERNMNYTQRNVEPKERQGLEVNRSLLFFEGLKERVKVQLNALKRKAGVGYQGSL